MKKWYKYLLSFCAKKNQSKALPSATTCAYGRVFRPVKKEKELVCRMDFECEGL